jgi:hypothetical protein
VSNDLFTSKEDPFDDPLWQRALAMAGAPPRPAKGYVTCNLDWLARVLPLVRNVKQLVILQLLYRKCLIGRSRTVSLSNRELLPFGISRQAKYRALAALKEARAVATKSGRNGKPLVVTLHDFP